MKHVLIVGGGFAGLNTAKVLGNFSIVKVTLIDINNYHLFQPLLYQVAMAGLSPADIAMPIRSILSKYQNIAVYQRNVTRIDLKQRKVYTKFCEHAYDYLVLAAGAIPSYFGNEHWEKNAPGLKTIEQATEIRRRVLSAFERAECENDIRKRKRSLTFVIIGAGPTGVELAGAIGEMAHFTMKRDFRNIDPEQIRIILVQSGPRILPTFEEDLSMKATRDLENLGVQIQTFSRVTEIDADGVYIGGEKIESDTILWAAGVQAVRLNIDPPAKLDKKGRLLAESDLSLPGYHNAFVAGDQAHFNHQTGKPLPGLAPVAMQQGKFIAQNIIREIKAKPRESFTYLDKGQLATIGRNKAIAQLKAFKAGGFFAWCIWLLIHIFYLIGFKNRFFVILNLTWSYLTYKKGARLIVRKTWRLYGSPEDERQE